MSEEGLLIPSTLKAWAQACVLSEPEANSIHHFYLGHESSMNPSLVGFLNFQFNSHVWVRHLAHKVWQCFPLLSRQPWTALQEMTTRPLKYLRFLGFITAGVEGALSVSATSAQVDDTLTDVALLSQNTFISLKVISIYVSQNWTSSSIVPIRFMDPCGGHLYLWMVVFRNPDEVHLEGKLKVETTMSVSSLAQHLSCVKESISFQTQRATM